MTSPYDPAISAIEKAAAAAARTAKVAADVARTANDLAVQAASSDRESIAKLLADSAAIRRAVLGERVDGVQTSTGLTDDFKMMNTRVKRLERGMLGLMLLIPGAVYGGESAVNWLKGLFA